MKLQYLSDNTGKTTGVFIPISDWNELKTKFKELDSEEIEIPKNQIKEVQKRLLNHKDNPEAALDFDKTIDEIVSNL